MAYKLSRYEYDVPMRYVGFKKPPTEKQIEARRKTAANNFKQP